MSTSKPMKTNYEAMSEEDINRASAELAGFKRRKDIGGDDSYYLTSPNNEVFVIGTKVGNFPIWHPSQDLNQTIKYLLPVVKEKGFRLHIDFDLERVSIGNKAFHEFRFLHEESWEDPDQIARTTLNCIMESLEVAK